MVYNGTEWHSADCNCQGCTEHFQLDLPEDEKWCNVCQGECIDEQAYQATQDKDWHFSKKLEQWAENLLAKGREELAQKRKRGSSFLNGFFEWLHNNEEKCYAPDHECFCSKCDEKRNEKAEARRDEIKEGSLF